MKAFLYFMILLLLWQLLWWQSFYEPQVCDTLSPSSSYSSTASKDVNALQTLTSFCKISCCPFPGLSDLPSLGIHTYLYLTVFSMHLPSTGQTNWTLILKLASLEPVSSLLFLIHCGQIVLIAHIIIFEFLDKSWASDISPWQFVPFSVYLFIPKSLLVTVVF